MSESANEIGLKLRFLLEEAVQKNLTDGILLSGGLDTSILATVASKFARLKAFTCAFQGAPAPDVECAKLMATKLKLRHFIHYFSEDELFEAIPFVVRTLELFDPMLVRNNITILIASKFAKDNGADSVITGDALDELFAGYPWLFSLEKEKLDVELLKMWDVMTFSSVPIGKAVGVEVKIPYLDPDFKSFAMKLDSQYKIQEERGKKWGKWNLHLYPNSFPNRHGGKSHHIPHLQQFHVELFFFQAKEPRISCEEFVKCVACYNAVCAIVLGELRCDENC